jgi:hypothetical protein
MDQDVVVDTGDLVVGKAAKYRELFDALTMGVVRSLGRLLPDSSTRNSPFLIISSLFGLFLAEKRDSVVDVKIKECKPSTETQLRMWEKRFRPLPSDLRNLYLTSNGMLLRWNVNLTGALIPTRKGEELS